MVVGTGGVDGDGAGAGRCYFTVVPSKSPIKVELSDTTYVSSSPVRLGNFRIPLCKSSSPLFAHQDLWPQLTDKILKACINTRIISTR